MPKEKVGITLSKDTLDNLKFLVSYYEKLEGLKLSKSQVITRLINTEKMKKEA